MNPFIDTELQVLRKAFTNKDGRFVEYFRDFPQSVSVFPDGIMALMFLATYHPASLRLLMKILYCIQEEGDTFYIPREQYASDLNWTMQTLNNNISKLIKAKCIAKVYGKRSLYYINLKYFFKGNRAKFVYSTYGSNNSGHLFPTDTSHDNPD